MSVRLLHRFRPGVQNSGDLAVGILKRGDDSATVSIGWNPEYGGIAALCLHVERVTSDLRGDAGRE